MRAVDTPKTCVANNQFAIIKLHFLHYGGIRDRGARATCHAPSSRKGHCPLQSVAGLKGGIFKRAVRKIPSKRGHRRSMP